ncbi:MAG: hypothetical protein ACEQSX_08215 [Baekduiaceae bacterium]
MGWTYETSSLANPTSSGYPAAYVRATIGDTESTALKTLQDEEVQFFIDQSGSLNGASALAARGLAAKYATVPAQKRVGPFALVRDEYKRLISLSSSLRTAELGFAMPLVGGVQVSDKENRERDTDRVLPAFVRGQDDYAGATPDSHVSRSTLGGWF